MSDVIAGDFYDLSTQHWGENLVVTSQQSFSSMQLALEQTLGIVKQIIHFQRSG